MTALDLPPLLEIARTAVTDAEQHFSTAGPSTVAAKGDRDVVSDVDVTIERQIRTALRDATPHIGLLGEEEGPHGPHTRTRWILDPVDGTTNFIRGMPLYAISLALVHDNLAVLGVISLPTLHRRYWAAPGLGAWRDGHPIQAAATRSLREAMVAFGDFGTGATPQSETNSTSRS